MDNAPRVLAGRYEVGELIGRGGMAEVHIGHDTRLGRTVAIKILRSDLARDPSFLARFRREAQAAASLNHPAIVAVYDTGEDVFTDPTGNSVHVPFIVMEYVEGHTVRDILHDGQAVPIEEAIEITAGVLAALEYSHHAGIVHRDIKPANVMITPTGAVKVMDFGIARAVADSAATMTQTHAVIGTAQYLSPEQARGETVDARSDLYSTGCLLYELLTGRPPFIGDSPVAVAYQHVREIASPPSAYAPDVPEVLDRITLKALAKERDDRYSSSAEFRADLESAARGGHVAAPAVAAFAAADMQPTMIENATQVMSPATVAPESPWGTTGAVAAAPPNGEEPPEEEKPSRKGLMWTLIAVGVIALATILTVWLLNRGPAAPELLTVPEITAEMSEAEARQLVEDAGFEFASLIDQDSDLAAGEFVRQDPAAGSQEPEDTVVTAYYSAGPDSTVVPNVAGRSQEEARRLLQEAGLEVGSVQQEESATVERDLVIRTDPAIDSAVPAGSTVTLYVSNGNVSLPDLRGQSRQQAESTLSDLGLTAVIETEESDEATDTVLRQSPDAGTVPQGQRVTLVIATERQVDTSTTVPGNLIGMTEQEAQEALGSAGLNPGPSIQQESDRYPAGIVIGSDPGGGRTANEGDTVRLIISSGPGPGGGDNNGDNGEDNEGEGG